jgi:hypothetical protein
MCSRSHRDHVPCFIGPAQLERRPEQQVFGIATQSSVETSEMFYAFLCISGVVLGVGDSKGTDVSHVGFDDLAEYADAVVSVECLCILLKLVP